MRPDSRRQAQRCHHQPISLIAVLFYFSSTEVAESEFRTQPVATAVSVTGRCRHHTCLYARRRTFFSCAHHNAQFDTLIRTFLMWHTALAQGKRNRLRWKREKTKPLCRRSLE